MRRAGNAQSSMRDAPFALAYDGDEHKAYQEDFTFSTNITSGDDIKTEHGSTVEEEELFSSLPASIDISDENTPPCPKLNLVLTEPAPYQAASPADVFHPNLVPLPDVTPLATLYKVSSTIICMGALIDTCAQRSVIGAQLDVAFTTAMAIHPRIRCIIQRYRFDGTILGTTRAVWMTIPTPASTIIE